MAGFFGLFDYSKPGPGVYKNAPKKKPFVVFFEIFTRKFWKLIVANLFFVLFSLPVVTAGLAFSGLSYITRNFAREKHAFIASDFVDTIKKNWKQGLAVGIINLVIQAVLIFDIYFFYSSSSTFGLIMLAVILSMLLIFTFMKYYIYFMLITFKLNLKQIYKNSFIFAFAGLGRNFLLFVIFGLFYVLGVSLFFLNPFVGITVNLFAYIFVFPAFRMLLIQFTVFPLIKKHMIDPYYKEHPGEDKEALYALNIADEDDEDEDRVFEDIQPDDEEDQPKTTIPRQYSQEEMQRLRRKHETSYEDDDDDTI